MFPQFPVAVSMVVTNRAQDKILLAKHVEDEDFILFAGYIKKGENGYYVTIKVVYKDEPLMELTVYAVDFEQAEQIKRNFLKNPSHVYSTVAASLFI